MEKYEQDRGKLKVSVQQLVLPGDLLHNAGWPKCAGSGARGQGSRSHWQCEGSVESPGQCALRDAA